MTSTLLAIGDSITKGDGEPMLGIACRSWAAWLARALGQDLVNLAWNGATVNDMLVEQLPRAPSQAQVGAVYGGVNDVRSLTFDLAAFEQRFDELLGGVAARAAAVVACTIPIDLGRPRAGTKVLEANAVIRAASARHGAAVAELVDLAGRSVVMPDAVHLWATGQLEVADRVALALGVLTLPSAGVPVDRSPRAVARFAASKLVREQARDGRRRAVEFVQRNLNG